VPRKVLAKKSIFEVGFKNPFNFSGTPEQDSRLPDFTVNQNKISKGGGNVGFNIMGSSGENLTLSYDGGKRSANITKKTLEKGAGTLMGMAPRFETQQTQIIGQDGKREIVSNRNQVQGFNYANPNFTNAVENNKKLQEAKSYFGIGSVLVDKKTQFDNAQKKIDLILNARVGTTLPDALKGGAVENALDPYYKTEQQEINQANTNARLKQASRNKVTNAFASLTTNPTTAYANQIQGELGRSPITVIVTRRRRGRWSTSLSANPADIINDYNKKQALINWAQEVDPDHAKVNPDLTMDVVASSSYKTIQTPVYRTGRNSGMDYRYHVEATHTYKTVNRKDTMNKGDTMDWIYAKVNAQAESKKKKYETYYKSDPKVGTFNYYAITDSEFDEMDKYKGDLVTSIRNTESAKYGLEEKLSTSFSLDATTPLDDNSPKQTYLKYQKTGQDSFITPTVAGLSSKLVSSEESEKQNLTNAIKFVEGKLKDLSISGNVVASRDNLGRVTISDQTSYEKYIKNTPSEYLKQPDNLDNTIIPELEKENTEQGSKYSEIEKEYYRKERAKAQFAGVTKPMRNYTRNAKRRD
jgi:CRISPR/Cas system-associated protein endoribonuclease Cas2